MRNATQRKHPQHFSTNKPTRRAKHLVEADTSKQRVQHVVGPSQANEDVGFPHKLLGSAPVLVESRVWLVQTWELTPAFSLASPVLLL